MAWRKFISRAKIFARARGKKVVICFDDANLLSARKTISSELSCVIEKKNLTHYFFSATAAFAAGSGRLAGLIIENILINLFRKVDVKLRFGVI